MSTHYICVCGEIIFPRYSLLALAVHLYTQPTDGQEVSSFISTGFCNILSWRLILNNFLLSFSPVCSGKQTGLT